MRRRNPQQPLFTRALSILACLGVLVGGSARVSGGVILHVDDHGCVRLELASLLHAHHHHDHDDRGAGRAPRDPCVDADHSHLHVLLGPGGHTASASRKLERRGTSAWADDEPAPGDRAPLAFADPAGHSPEPVAGVRQAGQPPWAAAIAARASLRSVVLVR